MIKPARIRAFTIMELVVGMLISGIVIGIVYYVLVLFNRQWTGYQKKSAEENSFLLFQSVLERDMERASVVVDTAEKTGFIISAINSPSIRYMTGGGLITRTSGEVVDTFYNKAVITGIKYVDDSLPLVKSISMQLVVNGAAIPVMYEKQYTASELMAAVAATHE